MIPKIIHYCWFGGNPLPELAQKCIASWKTFCPDYEIKEWNENNYDISKNAYMAAAYKEKKWGFVPDYIRFDLIYTYGGFYLDTDVEVIKSFDTLLSHKGILGFESINYVNGGNIVAGESGLNIFKEMRDMYDNVSFYKEDGTLNLVASPVYNTDILASHGMQKNNTLQVIEGITIFPTEYFCPKAPSTGKINITPNTYTIHHFDGSWIEDWKLEIRRFNYQLNKKINQKEVEKIISEAYYIIAALKHYGIKKGLKKGFNVLINRIKSIPK